MARYSKVDSKLFRTEKEAEAWLKKQKADRKAAGMSLKIETNFLEETGQWMGIIYMKVEV